MADTHPFEPYAVPHTLWRIAPGHGHTIPVAPHIFIQIGDEDIKRCILGGAEEILDLTKHVGHYRAGVQLGVIAINTTWAFVFTSKGFEARLCFASNEMLEALMNDERNIPWLMERVSVLLGVITDVFPQVDLTRPQATRP